MLTNMKIRTFEVQLSGQQKKQSFIHEFLFNIEKTNSEPSQTSKVELLGKIVKGLMPLCFFEQSSILGVMHNRIKFLKFINNLY